MLHYRPWTIMKHVFINKNVFHYRPWTIMKHAFIQRVRLASPPPAAPRGRRRPEQRRAGPAGGPSGWVGDGIGDGEGADAEAGRAAPRPRRPSGRAERMGRGPCAGRGWAPLRSRAAQLSSAQLSSLRQARSWDMPCYLLDTCPLLEHALQHACDMTALETGLIMLSWRCAHG